jgi:hypothetical protein
MNRFRVVHLRPWRLVLLLLAAPCAFALADAGRAADVPPGPATIHFEVIGAGHEIGLPPANFELKVTSASDGSTQTVERLDLTTSDGSRCPGVGPLCSGDVQVTAASGGTQFRIDTILGPDDRVPVYSGDCNGAGNPTIGTFGGLTLAENQTKTCRVTFVRPDTTAGDTPDSALLVTKTFEPDPNGHPDGHLELFLPTDLASPSVSVLLHDLRNSGGLGSGLCPLLDPAPVCELAITLGGDIWDPLPPRLDEETASDWLPIYGGDCNRVGQLITDVNPDGDLFQCSVDNVHLEAQSGTAPTGIVRLQVDAPGDTSSPPQNAQLAVLDHNFVDVADIGVKAQMRLDDGTACQGLGSTLCTGDVGVAATAAPESFIVEVGTAPAGYTENFLGDCTAAASGDRAQVTVGKGQVATCHVTFTPPPAPPTMLIAPASGERNSSLTASSVDPCPAGTGSVELTYTQTNPQGGSFVNTVVITPAADGSWSNAFTPTHAGDVTVDASCLVVTNTTETRIAYVPATWTFLAEPPLVSIMLTGPNGGLPGGKKGWFVSGPVTGTVSADDETTGGSTISTIDCGPLSLQTSGLGTPTASATFSIGVDGIADISCTGTDSAGNTSAPVSLEVKLDTHAPVVGRNAAGDACSQPGNAGWCRGTQTAGFSASDTTSGVASPCTAAGGSSCLFTQSTSAEGAAVSIPSGAVCDVAGNCNPGIGAGPFQIDATAPTVTRNASADSCSVPGSAGWCRGVQTAGFSAGDSTSGVASTCSGASCDFTQSTSTEGAAVKIASGQVCDVAGNCNPGIDAGPFQVDSTPPAVTRHASADSCSLPGNAGWCRGTQTAGFSASDALSGVASPCSGGSCDFARSSSQEGTVVRIGSGQVCDVAGNCNPGIDAGPFQVDPTPPKLAPTISPSPVLLLGSATATPNATDATSGIASQGCGAVDTSTPGIHTLTCTATDVAGNTATAQVGYLVEYKIIGFFSPVPNSKWKQGQNVPVKFALAGANGVQISDSEAQSLLSPTCRVMFAATGAQTVSDCVKYDTVKHQFVYDWKLGPRTGNETIAVRVSYPGTTATTSLSEPILITS